MKPAIQGDNLHMVSRTLHCEKPASRISIAINNFMHDGTVQPDLNSLPSLGLLLGTMCSAWLLRTKLRHRRAESGHCVLQVWSRGVGMSPTTAGRRQRGHPYRARLLRPDLTSKACGRRATCALNIWGMELAL